MLNYLTRPMVTYQTIITVKQIEAEEVKLFSQVKL